MKSTLRTFTILALLALPLSAWAAGFAVWEMGTKSSALGGTMTASADDPTAIFFNPAGLAGLEGSNFSLDLTGISPKTEFSGVAPNPGFGVTERLADHFFLLPQAYYSRSLGKDLAFGLGFYTPYGLAVEW
ncbi:MAG: outer membrane protein transport protein, partial [Candidatus Krumholzibacteria bacterium]|nr:outer membrane protein transport protein [Candidatus Krumholzibacteria bacterium]